MVQFEPGLMLELLESEGGTHMLGVPTMLIAAMEHPDFKKRDLTRVRGVCSGGSTVPAELVRRIESDLGVNFSIVYGQTESSPAITLAYPDDTPEDKANTLGPALPQTEVKVIDPESGEVVPIGTQGELCTRGYLVMLEYFEMPDKTAEAIDQEGWLHTGDLVTMDERGYTTITGRLKDMIIRGGENIYPREIEEVLFEHPKVAEVAVVGLPDPKWGEIVAAFIRDGRSHRRRRRPGPARLSEEPSGGDQDSQAMVPRRRLSPHRIGQDPEVRPPGDVAKRRVRGLGSCVRGMDRRVGQVALRRGRGGNHHQAKRRDCKDDR